MPSVLWGFLLVQQGNREGRLTVGHYSNFRCAVCSVGLTVRAKGRADGMLVTIAIVRCAVCTVGLTVSATGRADCLLVNIEILRCAVCTVGLTVSATGRAN